MNGGEVIDECAIEIEEDGAVAHGRKQPCGLEGRREKEKAVRQAASGHFSKKYLVNIPGSSEIGRDERIFVASPS